MLFENFALPFLIGTAFLFIFIAITFTKWILGLSKIDKLRIWNSLMTRKTLRAIKEAISEGLLHRKIFRKNPVLGYMHMSLAFGWFLLIFVGHIETMVAMKTVSPPLWASIFHRHFFTGSPESAIAGILTATMDLLLLFILTGVGLAYFKRFNRRVFGMKKTTRLKAGDRIALFALWLIFPLRFFAESFTAGIYHNGSFMSQPAGNFFSTFLPLDELVKPTWWAYSSALGLFLIFLPNSRYMHIPSEILYIFLKNYGIKLKKEFNTFSQVQVYSCSRCGICLDSCQLNSAGIQNTQSVYVLKNIRNHNLTDEVLFNCLLCGKCQQSCPVDIKLNDLRITQRIESTLQYNSSYGYLRNGPSKITDVIYFAGCMTHLTPGIKKAMVTILDAAKINYWFMDEFKAPCCGRPLMQAGQYEAAQKLIENNRLKILGSGAKQLVVSCPICYKVFKEDYSLPNVKVLHHSEYILELVRSHKIDINPTHLRVAYHDPCELGRGSNIYRQPRELLQSFSQLAQLKNEKENSLCCGGSLSNIKIEMGERDKIRDIVLEEFTKTGADYIATACPLCKKTFSKGKNIAIADIAELTVMAMKNQSPAEAGTQKTKKAKTPEPQMV